MSKPVVLDVCGLNVRGPQGQAILEDVNLQLRAGEITAIVGETGSGKTTLLNSILGLLPSGFAMKVNQLRVGEELEIDLMNLEPREFRRQLGRRIGYVPQDVRSGLNPLMTARATVLEAARRGTRPARPRVDSAMCRAGLP